MDVEETPGDAEEEAGAGLDALGQAPILVVTIPTKAPHCPTGAGLVVMVI